MDAIVAWLQANASTSWVAIVILAFVILGTLLDLAEKVISMTATKKDDEVFARVTAAWYAKPIVYILKKFSIANHLKVEPKGPNA